MKLKVELQNEQTKQNKQSKRTDDSHSSTKLKKQTKPKKTDSRAQRKEKFAYSEPRTVETADL